MIKQDIKEFIDNIPIDKSNGGLMVEISKLSIFIEDYANKRIKDVLDRLDKSMPAAEQLATKYGYHLPEKQYGYRLALHDIREVIEAERKQLEGGE